MKYDFKLKELREDKGLTQEDLAITLNVTKQSIDKWESKEIVPSMEVLIQLAIFFQVDINNIYNVLINNGKSIEDENSFGTAQGLRLFDYYSTDNIYHGNIGIKLKNNEHSLWLPVSYSTFCRIQSEVLNAEPYAIDSINGAAFFFLRSLNNKLIAFSYSSLEKLTFISDSEDELANDWNLDFSHEYSGIDRVLLSALHDICQGQYSKNEEIYPEGYKDFLEEWMLNYGYINEKGEINSDKFEWIYKTLVYYENGNKDSFYQIATEEFLDDFLLTESPVLKIDTHNGHSLIKSDSIAFISIPVINMN